MALDPGVVDSVTNSNFKVMAEAGVTAYLSHTQRLQLIAEKALAKSLESMDVNSVVEGLGPAGAAVAGYQQMIKGAGNTPPVTP